MSSSVTNSTRGTLYRGLIGECNFLTSQKEIPADVLVRCAERAFLIFPNTKLCTGYQKLALECLSNPEKLALPGRDLYRKKVTELTFLLLETSLTISKLQPSYIQELLAKIAPEFYFQFQEFSKDFGAILTEDQKDALHFATQHYIANALRTELKIDKVQPPRQWYKLLYVNRKFILA